jgi:hypothetical protein
MLYRAGKSEMRARNRAAMHEVFKMGGDSMVNVC